MDVREKLVEIIQNSVGGCARHWAEVIADGLIAHGVTVQEWISVKDGLPEIPEGWAESPERVLYMMKNTKTIYAGYFGEGGVWRDKYFRQYADSRNGVDADDVLCWMYQHDLPQPPKGETIYCKDCENLMFSDCYGECAKAYKGVVHPDDTCKHGVRRKPEGDDGR